MAQQVYNVAKESDDLLVSNINPVEYTSDEAEALEYDTSMDAMTAASYFTSVTGLNHVVVGPHPKPRH